MSGFAGEAVDIADFYHQAHLSVGAAKVVPAPKHSKAAPARNQ
ncbi:hypothetical protein ACIP5L_22670 [Streptomyces bacillaris]